MKAGIIAIIVLIILSIFYSYNHWSNANFSDSFWSNWLATVLGVVISVPIALGINRIQVSADLKKRNLEAKTELTQKTEKILSLLKKEIEENIEQLKHRMKADLDGAMKRTVSLPSLRTDLWRAFSDGGELHWIQDLDLLHAIADSYYSTFQIVFLEAQYFTILHFPGGRYSNPEADVLKYMVDLDKGVLESMGEAVEAISNKLLTIKNSNAAK